MATTSTARARLTDEELSRMLALIKGSDSVELKLTVPESATVRIAALGIDPLEAQIRQVFFFDTPDLALSGSGVVVRARRVQGKGDDSVVKLRPVVPDGPVRRAAPVAPASASRSTRCRAVRLLGSLKGTPTTADVRATVAGEPAAAQAVLQGAARVLRRTRTRGIGLDDLTVLGPIFVLKLKLTPEELDRRRLVAEMWLYPDGSRLLELSTKCLPAEAFQVAAEVRAFLSRARRRHRRRAADQDEEGARVLRRTRRRPRWLTTRLPFRRRRPSSIRSGVPRWLRNAPGWRGGAPRWAPPPERSLWAGSPRNCSTSPPGRTFCSAAATPRSRSGCCSSELNANASWSMR